MKILVTGGAGFIGSHLVDKLIKLKHQVFVVDDLSTGKKKFVNRKSKFKKIKIQDKNIELLFKNNNFDVIFHLAAQKNLQYSKEYPVLDAETNIIGSLNILRNALKYKSKKVIFYSTAAVYDADAPPPNKETDYPKPITPYGIAKYCFEKYLENSRINYTILRLSNVFGPRQDAIGEGGVVSIFCENLVRDTKSIIFNSGRQTRDFIFVDDVINASIKSIKKGNRKIINISTTNELSIYKLYEILTNISKKKLDVCRKKGQEEQYRSALDNNLAKKELSFHANKNIFNNLTKTYNWFKEQYGK